MAYRKHFSVESLTEVTNTSDVTWVSGLTYTFAAADQDASSDYLVLWSCEVSPESTSSDVQLRVTQAGSTVAAGNNEAKEGGTPVDYISQGGFFRFQSASTPADTAYAIQIKNEVAGTDDFLKNCRLSIIKLGANDAFVESTARVQTTSSTFQAGAALSFTPPSSGDYIILASFQGDASSTTGKSEFRLSDGTNTSWTLLYGPRDSNTITSGVMGWHRTSLTGSLTYTLQYRNSSAGNACGVSNQRIVALRLADFDNTWVTTLGSTSTGTQTTYTDALTLTQTTQGRDHLELAAWAMLGDNTSQSHFTRFLSDATSVDEHLHEAYVSDGHTRAFSQRIANLSAASHTWKIQRHTETSANTSVIAGAVIVVLDLGDPATGYTGTGSATLGISSTASGSHGVAGTAAASLGIAGAGSGVHGVSGTAAATLATTGDGSGTHIAPVTGTAAATLAIEGTGTAGHGVSGTASATLGLAGDGSGDHAPFAGTGSAALEITATATGSHVPYVGTSAATLDLVSTATGAHGVSGTAASDLFITGDGSGEFEQAEVTGTGSATLSISGSATGVHGVTGAGAPSLDIIGDGAGSQGVVGSASATLAITATGSGDHVPYAGTGAATLGITGSGTGSHTPFIGTGAATLEIASTATGSHTPYVGAGAATLGIAGSGDGVHGVAGTASAALDVTGEGEGTHTPPGFAGTGAATLAVTGDGAGTYTPPEVTGTAAATLALSGTGQGAHGASGAATATLGILAAAIGSHGAAGTGSAVLGVSGAADGVHGVVGSGSVDLTISALASGTHGVSGIGSAQLDLTALGVGFYGQASETPAERILAVLAESRALAVSAESRALTVSAESRGLAVQAEGLGDVGRFLFPDGTWDDDVIWDDDLIFAPGDTPLGRVLLVAAENRSLAVPADPNIL